MYVFTVWTALRIAWCAKTKVIPRSVNIRTRTRKEDRSTSMARRRATPCSCTLMTSKLLGTGRLRVWCRDSACSREPRLRQCLPRVFLKWCANYPFATTACGLPSSAGDYHRLWARWARHNIEALGASGRFFLSGGCGIPPEAPPENIRAMTNAARQYSQQNAS